MYYFILVCLQWPTQSQMFFQFVRSVPCRKKVFIKKTVELSLKKYLCKILI